MFLVYVLTKFRIAKYKRTVMIATGFRLLDHSKQIFSLDIAAIFLKKVISSNAYLKRWS